ncbi:MAG: hypothetical protein JXB07_18550, partial [Anaerolineae bacterium]|nr:hypothetical protein [Anaerolineae bacterium]
MVVRIVASGARTSPAKLIRLCRRMRNSLDNRSWPIELSRATARSICAAFRGGPAYAGRHGCRRSAAMSGAIDGIPARWHEYHPDARARPAGNIEEPVEMAIHVNNSTPF